MLYEGYLLYPYRQSAQKNQARFQFGVLMPPAYRAVDEREPSASQTECLVECPDDAGVDIWPAFLQLQRRTVQRIDAGHRRGQRRGHAAGGRHRVHARGTRRWSGSSRLSVPVADLLGADAELRSDIGARSGGRGPHRPGRAPAGRLVRRWARLDAVLVVRAERVAGPYGALRLRVRVENRTAAAGRRCAAGDDGLRTR